jgi:hypothetical protein
MDCSKTRSRSSLAAALASHHAAFAEYGACVVVNDTGGC